MVMPSSVRRRMECIRESMAEDPFVVIRLHKKLRRSIALFSGFLEVFAGGLGYLLRRFEWMSRRENLFKTS